MTTPITAKVTATTRVFWSIAIMDAIGLLIVFIMMLSDNKGQHDGGAAMGWFFLFQVPVLMLGLSMVLFYYTKHVLWHSLAVLIVASPVLLLLVFLIL